MNQGMSLHVQSYLFPPYSLLTLYTFDVFDITINLYFMLYTRISIRIIFILSFRGGGDQTESVLNILFL